MVFFALIIEEPPLVFSLQCVQLPTELTPLSLHSLLTLPSLGFGVGGALGVGERILRLPLSLVPLVELVALALVSLAPLVLFFPPLLGFSIQHLSMLLITI